MTEVGSLLNQNVVRYIDSRDWPSGLRYRMSEKRGYVQFTLFRDNFSAMDGEAQLQVASMVKEVMEGIRKTGIPIYLEVAKGSGGPV